MPAHKGTQPPGGSRKGKPNKATRELKEMILSALDKAGGVTYLTARAKDTPQAFLALLGKIIPQTVNATLRRSLSEYSDEELASIAGSLDGEEGTGAEAEIPRTLN